MSASALFRSWVSVDEADYEPAYLPPSFPEDQLPIYKNSLGTLFAEFDQAERAVQRLAERLEQHPDKNIRMKAVTWTLHLVELRNLLEEMRAIENE